MSTDDQFATYYLSFFMAMSTPNIMRNADIMSAFLCSDSSIADGVIRSSIYAGLCVYISLPGSPGSSILSFITSGDDSTTRSISKNASHVVGLRTAPRLAPRSALNGWGRSSSTLVGGIVFLSFFSQAEYAAGVRINLSLRCLSQ